MTDSVIIVGSGHIGLACARYLREDGYEVTVIDQGAIADGCSRGNCGFIVPSHVLPLTTPGAIADGFTSLFNPRAAFRVKPQARGDLVRWMFEFARRCTHRHMLEAAGVLHTLLEASAEEFEALLTDARLACEWQRRGMLFVFRSERALGAFADEDTLLTREFGVTARYLGSAELAEFEPALLDGLAGAYYYEGDSHLRPDRFNASLAVALEEDGVALKAQCSVDSVETDGEAIVSLETSQGQMSADHYVFATGAWSSQFAAALDCNIPVEPGKGYAVTMTCPDTMPSHPMLMPEKRIGVTPFESGYRIASMMEFAGFDTSIPRYRIRQLQDSARPYLRDPVGPAIEETWYGWRPMTWDSLPIIGRLPKLSNGLIATGHNMLGLTLAPITGRLIADLVGERQVSIPIDALSPVRFA